jgi:hypothetical protein
MKRRSIGCAFSFQFGFTPIVSYLLLSRLHDEEVRRAESGTGSERRKLDRRYAV